MLAESGVINFMQKVMENPNYDYTHLVEILIKNNFLVRTDDGTYTIKSENGNELMHSRVGALTEAFEKFALPSDIRNLKSPRVLDLCSGLGYNTLAALIHNENCLIDMIEIINPASAIFPIFILCLVSNNWRLY